MKETENIEILYWKNMNAIVIPQRKQTFFEGVEPFKQINSDGETNSDFRHIDDYISSNKINH